MILPSPFLSYSKNRNAQEVCDFYRIFIFNSYHDVPGVVLRVCSTLGATLVLPPPLELISTFMDGHHKPCA